MLMPILSDFPQADWGALLLLAGLLVGLVGHLRSAKARRRHQAARTFLQDELRSRGA